MLQFLFPVLEWIKNDIPTRTFLNSGLSFLEEHNYILVKYIQGFDLSRTSEIFLLLKSV